MPALTMRGRYLMREYWTDSDLFLRLSAEEREVYMGLWMLADDGGWMPRDVPAIAKALGGFEDREPRETRTKLTLERLRDLGKVLSYRCCLYIPAVAKYPRPGKKSYEHRIEHERHKSQSNGTGGIRTDLNTTLPDLTSPVPTQPDDAGASARGFDDAMVAAGVTEFVRRKKATA